MKWRNGGARGRGTLAVLVLLAIGVALGVGLFLFREKGRTAALVMAGTAAALQTVTALWALSAAEKRVGYKGHLKGRTKKGPPRDLYAADGSLWTFVENDKIKRLPPQGMGGMKV